MNAHGSYELEWTFGTERVYGCSEEEYRRRGWQSFLVGEGLARTEPRAHAALSARRDRRVHHADPSQRRAPSRWIEVKNRPIADPATGKFNRLVGVAIDITERKQAADALRESEFRYRTVAELTSGLRLRGHRRRPRRGPGGLGEPGLGRSSSAARSRSSTASAGGTYSFRRITPARSSAGRSCAAANAPRWRWR